MHSRLRDIPIAIIGMSTLFPDAKNIMDYWDNIVREVDCIRDVPPSRWNIEDYYDPDPTKEDKTYCKRGGFIPDIDFDPMEFGLPPNILEVTDIHQLLSLVLAKEVMRDGGYDNPSDELRENTGVILGVGGGQKLMIPLISRLQYPIWERVLKNVGLSEQDTRNIVEKIKKAYVGWEENSFPGALGNVIAGRIANRLDLGGTNSVVDAACASSLSGIRMAVSELLEYRADMMISGGVDSDNSPYMYLCFSKTQAFTANEKSTPFSAESDGMIMGEGMGMFLLKRLEDAEKDNDRIYAVIKGMGSSSDGRFKSIYAPRPKGQHMALERAYRDSGIEPSAVSMIEGHGTGTEAGDVAEITALKEFFLKHDHKKQHIALGSVKSQIGHTKNAAGAAGLSKVALALYHKILPATINIAEPNQQLELETSPFYLNTETRPWICATDDLPRRAGLSAFGFGGTNFHFILEEYQNYPTGPYRLQKVVQPYILHAGSPEALAGVCEDILQEISRTENDDEYRLLSRSNNPESIPADRSRLGFTAKSNDEVIERLETAIKKLQQSPDEEEWSLRNGIHYRKKGMDPTGKVVALFAGQGSPYLNMGKELVCNFPPLMKNQAEMDDLFKKDSLEPLSKIVYPIPVFDKAEKKQQEKQLQLTQNAQPAIGVFSAGLYQLLRQAGFKPDFTAGHSFGELTALWAAEVINDEDYFKLAKARGKAMAAPDDPDFDAGSMLAVMGDVENLEEDLVDFPEVTIANNNSRNQVVVAGPKADIENAKNKLKEKYKVIQLGVSAAFHTKLVGHAQKPFAEEIESVTFRKPKCRVFSNATAKPYPQTPKSIRSMLQDHILNSVQFKKEIENIYDSGGYVFIEFGPQSILSRLVGNILEGKPHISIAMNANSKRDSDVQFRDAVVQLKVSGLSLKNVDPYEKTAVVPEKKKAAMTLKIGGSNYVSEKTRREFEEALQDGYKVTAAANRQQQADIPQTPEKEMSTSEHREEKNESPQSRNENLGYSMQSLERGLANFYNHQNETLRIHEQFLNNQSEYSRSFFQIMQQQAQSGMNTIPPEVSQSIAHFHSHQGETLRIHEQYLRHQTEYAKYSFELIRQQQSALNGQPVSTGPAGEQAQPQPQAPVHYEPQSAYTPPPMPKAPQPAYTPPPVQPKPQPAYTPPPEPVAPRSAAHPSPPETAAAQQPSGFSRESLVKTLLGVVAEKTGYQSEMLELSMDMEADLGIDSIKRVEILNGIQEEMPDLPQLNPEELAELRTLEQIIDYMERQTTGSAASPAPPQPEPQPGARATASASPGPGKDQFVKVLLGVIAEKTGYQSEMLELDMDMEADLGIDSIKRVEILNGIQEKMPDLPQVNPEELAELRTLKQIADHMMPDSGGTAADTGQAAATSEPAAESGGTGPQQEQLVRTLLEVVSEKTGYLVEMLELSMDMEADLGIDSIKRVEILNGMQEKLPDLPEVNPEELAELRTLEQIAARMAEAGSVQNRPESAGIKKKQLN